MNITKSLCFTSKLHNQLKSCIIFAVFMWTQSLTPEYSYAKKYPTHSFSNARVVVQLPKYGCQLIRKSAAQREVRRVVGSSTGSNWQILLHMDLYTVHRVLIA